jgi:putative SOS response-associated peptidase YedK
VACAQSDLSAQLTPIASVQSASPTPLCARPFQFGQVGRAYGLSSGGVWEGWQSPDGEVLRTFAIITTAANRETSELHDRIPLVLAAADWRLWLGEEAGDAAELRPASDGTPRAWSVSPRGNSPRNNDARLIEPMRMAAENGVIRPRLSV